MKNYIYSFLFLILYYKTLLIECNECREENIGKYLTKCDINNKRKSKIIKK